jgi:N-dimethylarginine dimethylaminohydrolase
MWVPVLGILGVDALIAAAEGAASVLECREAKQRGAEIAEAARRKAEARAEAEAQWKRAYAAARADDCATVRALEPQVRALDVEFHDVVFMRDVGITRCLVGAR